MVWGGVGVPDRVARAVCVEETVGLDVVEAVQEAVTVRDDDGVVAAVCDAVDDIDTVWVAVSEDVRVDEEVGRAVLDPVTVAVWLGVVVTNPVGVTVGDPVADLVVVADCVAVIVQDAVGVGDQTDTVAV